MAGGWIEKDKHWDEYPLGTVALSNNTSGAWWVKRETGWKHRSGDTFPYPGDSHRVIPPHTHPLSNEEKSIIRERILMALDIVRMHGLCTNVRCTDIMNILMNKE